MSLLTIDIIDLENTSGTPTLVWISNEGNAYGSLRSTFDLKFPNPTNEYTVPILMQVVGSGVSGLSGDNIIENPRMNYSVNGITGYNENWTESSKAALISGYDLQPPSTTDASEVLTAFKGSHYAEAISGGSEDPIYLKRSVVGLVRLFQDEFQDYKYTSSGTSGAWLTYDMTSGFENKNIFGLSFEILHSISGLTGSGVSGSADATFSEQLSKPSRLVYYSGFRYSGYCNDVNLLIDVTGGSCVVDIPNRPEGSGPAEFCIASGLTRAQMSAKITDIVNGVSRVLSNQGKFQGDAIDDSEVGIGGEGMSYDIYQGVIEYNSPLSGDSFYFDPYDYNYTGDYVDEYNFAPPYPSSGFTFYYPQDYSGITGLVDRINQTLSGSGYYIWSPGVCEGDTSGYYETGALLKAYTGDSNTILIESMRAGTQGKYFMRFDAVARPSTTIYQNTYEQYNGFKYLLPNQIKVQGANVYGEWTDLSNKTPIDWGRVVPTRVRQIFQQMYTGFVTGDGGSVVIDPDQVTEAEVILDDFLASGVAVRNLVYEANISGRNRCGDPFSLDVNFYEVPSGFDCSATPEEDIAEFRPPPSQTLGITDKTRIVDYFYLKTGWKFDNTTGYNYYRIYLDDFQSNASTSTELQRSFIINGINFYSARSGVPIHTGETCLLGATYTGRIGGLTSGILSGTITGTADASGFLDFDHYQITGVPNGDGAVIFQRAPGLATTPFTGILTQRGTGTGYYVADVEGYYYNADSQCVEFIKQVSGTISGMGQLTGGPYNIIYDSVASGITGTQTVSGSGYGVVTGIITDFNYNFGNLPMFGTVTGLVSGIATTGTSGSVVIYQLITQTPTTGYSYVVSGTTEAQSILTYNSPASGDRIFINDFVVIYNPNTGLLAPTYFKTINELTNIINSGSGSFLATGYNDGSQIYLRAAVLGNLGNAINTYSSGSAGVPTFGATGFTGGYTQYTITTPTGAFTGVVDTTLYATGLFTGFGSGNLTGSVRQLDFIRYFTGIWGLGSGLLDFRTLNYVTGGGAKYQNSGFENLPSLTGHPTVIPFFVNYLNSPIVASNDLALLTITGYGAGTGLTMILSGQM